MIKIILLFLIFMGFVQLERECKTTEMGTEYRGTLSKTASGLQCQPWSQQSPHKQSYEDDVPSGSENYCRGTSDGLKPWCYTMDPSVRWEYCDVPFCPKECKTTLMGTEYRGTLSKTLTGRKCQAWSQHANIVPSGSENYCRNPSNALEPWCYTMDPNVSWEYCDVPFCPRECKTTAMGTEFRGTLSKTINGHKCQPWNQQSPHKNDYENKIPSGSENYCRNPDNGSKPWCYTMNPTVRWEYCDVPFCPKECKTTEMGIEYRGTLSKTLTGLQCQPWSQQSPHKETYGDKVPRGSENYCRNPDNRSKLWCYTMNPTVRWEYCDVPFCKDFY